MPIQDKKTVWILGAGFSRSLGGPLLEDLLRQEDLSDLVPLIPPTEYGGLADDVYATQGLFNWGRDHERAWGDAEEFLAFAELAFGKTKDAVRVARFRSIVTRAKTFRPGPGEPRPLHMLSTVVKDLNDPLPSFKRALAFQSARFLIGANPRQEQWKPYQAWADSLDSQKDVVLTFNYDTVLETINPVLFDPVLPNASPREDAVPVYKLHGSVNWILQDGRPVVAEPLASLKKRADILLATPSPLRNAAVAPLFEALWLPAMTAISDASFVVVIGYSFPRSAAQTRTRLLDALTRNAVERARQTHLVLGPDVRRPAARRVLELLGPRGAEGGGIPVRQHQLWAEDFIADYPYRTRPPVTRPQADAPR